MSQIKGDQVAILELYLRWRALHTRPVKAIFVADSSPCCSVLNIHALASFQNCQKTAPCVTLGEWWNVVTTVEVVAARGPPCPCFVPVWDSCGL